ncbi:hypothetical protein EGW08_007713, partial [Elysia chlorotica]
MQVACFSYDVRLYPRKELRCLSSDPHCELTAPLRVIYDRQISFTFGEDKVWKYILLFLLWMFGLCVLHFAAWFAQSANWFGAVPDEGRSDFGRKSRRTIYLKDMPAMKPVDDLQ